MRSITTCSSAPPPSATRTSLPAIRSKPSTPTGRTDNPGWLYTPWAGTPEQEDELSKQHKITIRCIPLDSVPLPQTPAGKCFLTGKETATRALWGRSY